jgi:hypothetical protein
MAMFQFIQIHEAVALCILIKAEDGEASDLSCRPIMDFRNSTARWD